jgi:uncharacterized coiled-coil DUF342 family protein
MKPTELRRLKIKLANLQSEIQYLIDKSENDSSLIDAISSDIAEFTDEVTKFRKEIDSIKEKKLQKESLKLTELYKAIKKDGKYTSK